MKQLFAIITFVVCFVLESCHREFSNIVTEANAFASQECGDKPVKNLTDSDSLTMWNACNSGSQWVNFHFKKPVEVKAIQFVMHTSKPAAVLVNILSKKEGELDYKNIVSKEINVSKSDPISIDFKAEEVSDFKLVINNDSSWVCIQDVKITGR